MILSNLKRHATDYRADIDGLRAVAILMVVIYHAFPSSLKKGFMGVDVFFVISGFLITKIILNELNNGVFTLKNFYLRRAKRILPALFTVLAFTCLMSFVVLTPQELKSLSQHIFASLLFVENFLLLKEVGYFDIAADSKPLLHLWSLSVEEQFYIFIPLILIAFHRFKINILPIILFTIVSTLIYNIYLVNGSRQLFDEGLNEAFYMLYARMWELSFGSLAAFLMLNKPNWSIKSKIIRDSLAILALILLMLAAFGLIKDKVQAIYAVIPAFILIYLTQNSFVNEKILSNPFLVFIGLISYPLYLWHWVLFALFKINEGVITTNASIILIAISFIFATLTYLYIERPFQALQNIVPKLFGATVVLAGFALVTTLSTPAIDNNDYPRITAKCYENAPSPKQLDWCYGQKNMVHTHAIVGDSHADHLFYGIAKANNSNKGFKLIGEGWCNFYLGQNLKTSKKNDCSDALIENALAQLKSEKQLETIIFASTAQYTPQSFEYISKTIDFFEDSNVNLIFVLDTPAMQVDIRQCGVRKALYYKVLPENPNCAIDKSKLLKQRQDYYAMFEKLKSQYPQVTFYNPLNSLCDEKTCPLFKDGVSLYRDDHHLSNLGSTLVGRDFITKAMPNR